MSGTIQDALTLVEDVIALTQTPEWAKVLADVAALEADLGALPAPAAPAPAVRPMPIGSAPAAPKLKGVEQLNAQNK